MVQTNNSLVSQIESQLRSEQLSNYHSWEHILKIVCYSFAPTDFR
jgi:hypothetical protein